MENRYKKIIEIFKGFREAVEIQAVNERKYKDKLIQMYSACASYIRKEYINIIPYEAQESYKFLIQFKQRQTTDRTIRDSKYPECKNLSINHTAFFYSLGSTASKAIQAIYKVYFVLQNEIYVIKSEYIYFNDKDKY